MVYSNRPVLCQVATKGAYRYDVAEWPNFAEQQHQQYQQEEILCPDLSQLLELGLNFLHHFLSILLISLFALLAAQKSTKRMNKVSAKFRESCDYPYHPKLEVFHVIYRTSQSDSSFLGDL